MKTRYLAWALGWMTVFGNISPVSAENSGKAWQTLPATPSLPKPATSGYAAVNGIKIWYAIFGRGESVILLHGGLANAEYWGKQVPELARHHQVIVMDSRGHGRSTRNDEPFSYHLMASDVVALMDALKVERAAVIGWSDGANVGLDMAIHYPERMTGLFAFAGNARVGEGKDASQSEVFNAYVARAEREYARLSPTPGQYRAFRGQLSAMWRSQPNLSVRELKSIKVPTWIVDGDHDELFTRETSEYLAEHIPSATLLIEKGVSHFAFLQDARQFNEDVLRFLSERGATR